MVLLIKKRNFVSIRRRAQFRREVRKCLLESPIIVLDEGHDGELIPCQWVPCAGAILPHSPAAELNGL